MSNKPSITTLVFRSLSGGFVAIALFSLAINLMMLAGPLYMMQVYDRVLGSRSFETLVALSVLLAGVFVVSGLLDPIRMRILNRLGGKFETQIGGFVFDSVMKRKVSGKAEPGESAVQDLHIFRDFLSGNTLIAFFDAPWVPIYLAILFVLHPLLGVLGTVGAVVLSLLAYSNDRFGRKPSQAAAAARRETDGVFQMCERNAEAMRSMGMNGDLRNRWTYLQASVNYIKTIATDRGSNFTVISKTFRLALQSAMLGLGAALAITGETSAGAMIASTIMLGRALAPVDQAIGQWRTFRGAVSAYNRLTKLVHDFPAPARSMTFPNANRTVEVTIHQAGAPTAQRAHLSGINFSLMAGDVAAIIGPSGSGKSTLARMLAGIWQPQRGDVTLDGVATNQWNEDDLGAQIGYLPQDVELFDGTIRENIARFSEVPDDNAILQAAMAADIHNMVLQMPDGYDTRIGPEGQFLSGGQRQRIGLARALYGDPFLLVLDEPNANLDATGDVALRRAVKIAQKRNAIVVVITHKPSTLDTVDKVLVLENGRQQAFGPKDEVLRSTTKAVAINAPAVPSISQLPKRVKS